MSDMGDVHISKAEAAPARRIEVFTGSGRRRSWSAADKAAIVAETFTGDETVSSVARRHGLTAPQLFAWRRQAGGPLAVRDEEAPRFIPAVLDASLEPTRQSRKRGKSHEAAGIVELEIDGVRVRVGRGAEAKTISAVIRALKAGA
jgi:transposase